MADPIRSQSLIITIPKGQPTALLEQSAISGSRAVIMNKLKPQAEDIH